MCDLTTHLRCIKKHGCSCGQSHDQVLPQNLFGTGLWPQLGEWLKKHGLNRIYLLADPNTYTAAGQDIVMSLTEQHIQVSSYIYQADRPEPDAKAVGLAMLHKPSNMDALIVVGSGTLNDIGKIIAHGASMTYVVVATAASMDGYTSSTASMLVHGQKVSLQAKAADLVVADYDVLASAPLQSMQSGVGDMVAKVISLTEWKMASIITGEPYCQDIAMVVDQAVWRVLAVAKDITCGDPHAVYQLFDGLYLSGLAMNLAGHSRPASGMEHYISHLWDMRAAAHGNKADTHGRQCGVASLIALDMMEETARLNPEDEACDATFDLAVWQDLLKKLLGAAAKPLIKLEKKEGKYDLVKIAKRLDIIRNNWSQIRLLLQSAVLKRDAIKTALLAVSGPTTVNELTITAAETQLVIKATKDIRDKYITTRLLFDLGQLDKITACVMKKRNT